MSLVIPIDTDKAQRAIKALRHEFSALGVDSKTSEKQMKKLEDRLVKGMGASRAQASMTALQKSLKLTNREMLVMRARAGDVGSIFRQLQGGMARAAKSFTGLKAAMAGLGVGLIVRSAVKSFADFETKLVDMGKVTSRSLEGLREEVMALPGELGTASELMEGYYQVISAGVKGVTEQHETLVTAAQTSAAAHVAQGEVIKGLTKIMAGYEGQIKSVSEAADLLFTIEKEGQTNVAELIPVVGGLASVSKTLGIHQNELGAALAQVSQFAGSTAEAATQYQAVLTGLLKPTEQMTTLMQRYGGVANLIAKEGFGGLLQVIRDAAEGTGDFVNALGDLFGRKEATLGFLALLKNDMQGYNDRLDSMENKTGAAKKAFDDWMKTFDAVKRRFDATINKLMIEFGQDLAPMLMDKMDGMVEWVENNKEMLLRFFDNFADAIGLVAKGFAAIADAAGKGLGAIDDFVKIIELFTDDTVTLKQALTLITGREGIKEIEQAFDVGGKHAASMRAEIIALTDELGALYSKQQKLYQNKEGAYVPLMGKAGLDIKEKEYEEAVAKIKAQIDILEDRFHRLYELDPAARAGIKLAKEGWEELEDVAWAYQMGLLEIEDKHKKVGKGAHTLSKELADMWSSIDVSVNYESAKAELDRIKSEFEKAGKDRVKIEKWYQDQLKNLHKKYYGDTEKEYYQHLKEMSEFNEAMEQHRIDLMGDGMAKELAMLDKRIEDWKYTAYEIAENEEELQEMLAKIEEAGQEERKKLWADFNKDRLENEKKSVEDMKRQWDDFATDLRRGLENAFYDMFNGTMNVWDSLVDYFKRTLAQLLAWIATQRVIVPIVTQILGGTGTGGVPTTGGGLLSGIFGGGGGMPNMGIQIPGLSSILGTPLPWASPPVSAYAGALAESGLTGGAGMTGAQTAAAGSTWGSFLGGAGAGFGAGMLLNSLLGGNQMGGTVGSAGGALLGAAIGSIIPGPGTILGGLIGGAAGGGLGGLFGGEELPHKYRALFGVDITDILAGEGGAVYERAGRGKGMYAEIDQAMQPALEQMATVVKAFGQTLAGYLEQYSLQLPDNLKSFSYTQYWTTRSPADAVSYALAVVENKLSNYAGQIATWAAENIIDQIDLTLFDAESEIRKALADYRTRKSWTLSHLQGFVDALQAVAETQKLFDEILYQAGVLAGEITPLEQRQREVNAQFDEWVRILEELGVAENKVLEVESKRAAALANLETSTGSLLGTLEDALSALQLSTANPADALERLAIAAGNLPDVIRSAEDLQAFQEYLQVAQDAYQRPSTEYGLIYDAVLAAIQEGIAHYVPAAQYGLDYVPDTGLYMLHKGEQVVPVSDKEKERTDAVSVYMTLNIANGDPITVENAVMDSMDRWWRNKGRQMSREDRRYAR